MCLLTYYPADTTPDPDALRTGAIANPHGHGFALVTRGRIVTGHSMNADKVIDAFTRLRARHRAGPALFHSRYATRGVIGLSNCHPFRLGGDQRTVLAHNGTLPKRVHPRAYDRRSDTRIAAEEYLAGQPFGPIDTVAGARGLSEWLGTSKLVILTVDPAYAHTAYLFGEQAGRWVEGIWYSNRTYLPRTRRASAQRWNLCGHCLRYEPDRVSRYCRDCGWCYECGAEFPHCRCRPGPPRQPSQALSPATGG
ncbi:class II glutamine amidotransferase [Nocardia nova]|uniref:class II glutamine amidotransferase n=1 Tax=Nocardia nova TaxID=37330 RepID=UPI0033D5CF29